MAIARRSLAYRQRLADLLGQPIVVPDTDETVAAGAAVQAAATLGAESFDELSRRWHLGVGTTVEPGHDAASVRDGYRLASG